MQLSGFLPMRALAAGNPLDVSGIPAQGGVHHRLQGGLGRHGYPYEHDGVGVKSLDRWFGVKLDSKRGHLQT